MAVCRQCGEEFENHEKGSWRNAQPQPHYVAVCRQCGKVFDVLRFKEHVQACKAVVGSLNAVERSAGMALELINRERLTVYRGDQENHILKEVNVQS